MDEAIHHRGTDFGLVFCDLSEDLFPLDMELGDCAVTAVLEQGGAGGPEIARVSADVTYRDMGVWSFSVPAGSTADWPDDVILVVAEYAPRSGAAIREPKALIHPYRSE